MINVNASYAQSTYMSVDISSLSPLDIVIKLYDGCINFLSKAILAIDKKDRIKKIQYLNKSRMIIEELMMALNMEEGGDISQNLQDLYTYMLLELTRANASDSVDKIYNVQGLLRTLRSAWAEIRPTAGQGGLSAGSTSIKVN